MNEFDTTVLHMPSNDDLRFLPEGPYQHGHGQLSWVAIQHGADAQIGSLNILDLQSGVNANYPLAGRPGFAFPTNEADSFVVGLERSVSIFNTKTGEYTEICDGVDANVSGTIVNDAVAFSGGLIFGAKDLEFSTKKAGLYLWRASDQQLIQLRNDQICSNGKAVLRRDGQQYLLDIDTPTKTVVEYSLNVESGTLGEARVVVDVRDGDVFPDGMILTPDEQSVIVAFYNPEDAEYGEARQHSLADGSVEAVWRTEASPRVTCPQLIEWQGAIHLVLTTAVEGMSPESLERHPNAGAIFIAKTDFDAPAAQPTFGLPR